jgi:hypothetical protein
MKDDRWGEVKAILGEVLETGADGFSKDGREVFGIDRKTTSGGPQWRLYPVDVNSGAERMLTTLDLDLPHPRLFTMGRLACIPMGNVF